jgi:hypothetical protein
MMIALLAGTIDHMSQPLPDTKSATQIWGGAVAFDR